MPPDYLIVVTSTTYYFETVHLECQRHQVVRHWIAQRQVGMGGQAHSVSS